MNKGKVNEEIKELEARLEKLKAEVNKTELEPYDWGNRSTYDITGCGHVINSDVSTDMIFKFSHTPNGLWQARDYTNQLRLNSMILRLKQALGDDWEFQYGLKNWYVYKAEDSFTTGYGNRVRNTGVIYFSSNENVQKVCDWINENWDYEKGQRK